VRAIDALYTQTVSAAHDYEDLHRLVDRLSPAQVRRLRVLAAADPELHDLLDSATERSEGGQARDRLLALAGLWTSGPSDAAQRHDELIRERFTRSS
jgi:hypothetical protein